MITSLSHGTCVIGQLSEDTAFASVEQNGTVWVKRYGSLEAALHEAKQCGLIDKLFAAAAALYIRGQHTHCLTPVASEVGGNKLTALGFSQPRLEA